jgi:hypothetical protein
MASLGQRIAIAFVLAGALCALSAMMAGAGHGWTTPLPVSTAMLIGFPAFGAATAVRNRTACLIVVLLVLVCLLASDWYLVMVTGTEGREYFRRALESMPEFTIPWLTIWIGAHAMLLFRLVTTLRR